MIDQLNGDFEGMRDEETRGKNRTNTGGTSGIGKATAFRFVSEGAKVVISNIQDEESLAVERELKAINGDAIYLHHDVSSEQSWKEVLEKTDSKFGGLDILFTKTLEYANKGRWHLSGKQAPHC